MAGDEYFSSQGPLKLKGVADTEIKKKKKKKKKTQQDLERHMEASIRREVEDLSSTERQSSFKDRYTKAEKRFKERQMKMEADRILKKASKTHKEKVEDFNRHLDSLTEHFDIPKVSWTK